MRSRKPVRHPILRSLFPVTLLSMLGICFALAWLVYAITHPPTHPYLVTPERIAQLSEHSARATDETWTNKDATHARGWLLRGGEGAPAILLLHAYGSDRSSLLNLGVKLNETLNCTVLWTDARAHGENPLPGASSFGAREADDAIDAINFLRSLKTETGEPLVSGDLGIYGVEMGAYSALVAASREPAVRALVLDSIAAQPAFVLRAALDKRAGAIASIVAPVARVGVQTYLFDFHANTPACEIAKGVSGSSLRVMLLSGADAGELRRATERVAECLPHRTSVEMNTELPLSNARVSLANSIEADAYDRRVIDFFDRALDGGS